MGCAASTPVEATAPQPAHVLAGSPPRPLMQQSTEQQIIIAMELSKKTAAEEQQSEEMLQRAIALSRDKARPAAAPGINRQTSEEQLQYALQLSRELAKGRSHVSAVQANVDQLRTAMALSLSMTSWAPPPFWAKGVGTAFEELVAGGWHPVTHPDIIDMLGRLTACNPIREVEYTVDGKACKTTMRDDGLLSQVEMATGAIRLLRLVPFFFQVEVSKGHWKAITAPEAITALTTVLASSMPHSYRCATDAGEQRYTTSLANEQGLMLQRNDQTGTTRSVRASPVGPDGRPHFEYLESAVDWKPGLSNWSPVSDEIARMLALCAAGRGDCHYGAGGFTYRATLTADGFIDQTNLTTGAVRPMRPAPWLGHGNARVTDATDGWVPQAQPVSEPAVAPFFAPPPQPTMATPIAMSNWGGPLYGADGRPIALQPAANFLEPQAVPMGTVVNPIAVPLVGAPPTLVPMAHAVGGGATAAQPVYYYQPQADSTVPMAIPLP